MDIVVRQASAYDATELGSILNEIIDIGGTTAYQTALSPSEVRDHFIDGERCICCFVAVKEDNILGFLGLSYHPNLADGWVDIATFARVSPKTPGVGKALFAATKEYCRERKYSWINATIRADNTQGLAYYTKMGFEDYSLAKDVPLQDGTLVDRISKKWAVNL